MKTEPHNRRPAALAIAAVALAAWLSAIAIAIANDASSGASRSALPRASEHQTPAAHPRASPANLPLAPSR